MSKKLTVMIIDDEKSVIDMLKYYILKYTPSLLCVGEAQTIEDGFSVFKKTKPDIVFLDIQLQGKNGFDFLDLIKDKTQRVVFITAHEEYALKAYSYRVNSYLVKPVSPSEFKEVVESLSKNYQIEKKLKKISFKSNDQTVLINEEDIVKISSQSPKRVIIFTEKKDYLIKKNIGEIEEKLSPVTFFKINQRIIINITFINHIDLKEREVHLKDLSVEKISVRRKADFIKFIN